MPLPTEPPPRHVALDLHKEYLVVGTVDAQQRVVMPPRRFSFPEFLDWAPAQLARTDLLVLEASSHAWHLYDLLLPLGASVTVTHPGLIKLTALARVKTDARDTLHLARLLVARLLTEVWVPPLEVREVRGLVAHRRRLVQQRTQARNRLHGVLQRHSLVSPPGKPFAAHHRAWWLHLPLSASVRLRVRQDLAVLDELETLISEGEMERGRLSTVAPWAELTPFLIQLPGWAF